MIRTTGRPVSTWLGTAHHLVAHRPVLAGVGLTSVLDLVVSAA